MIETYNAAHNWFILLYSLLQNVVHNHPLMLRIVSSNMHTIVIIATMRRNADNN